MIKKRTGESILRVVTEGDAYVNGDITVKRKVETGQRPLETGTRDKKTKGKFRSGKSSEEVGRRRPFLSQ
jgi:hypothetical protein